MAVQPVVVLVLIDGIAEIVEAEGAKVGGGVGVAVVEVDARLVEDVERGVGDGGGLGPCAASAAAAAAARRARDVRAVGREGIFDARA